MKFSLALFDISTGQNIQSLDRTPEPPGPAEVLTRTWCDEDLKSVHGMRQPRLKAAPKYK